MEELTSDNEMALAQPSLSSEVALLGQVQQMLVEAKTLPDFRRVMEAAGAASDTARRYAKLLEAQKMAAETIEATSRAANELSFLHIEAQAGAGRVLKAMAESGERAPRGAPGHKSNVAEGTFTLDDLGVSRPHARIWQALDDIPSEVRSTYLRQSQDSGEEVTTKGLLRFAKEPSPAKESNDVELAYSDVVNVLHKLLRYNPEVISGQAAVMKRSKQYIAILNNAREWLDSALSVYER